MGLLDILNGMQNGPRGEKEQGTGGMSPITMALLGLLAYKAVKHLSDQTTGQPASPGNPQIPPTASQAQADDGGLLGSLGNLLRGNTGSAPAGQTAGGGLGNLLPGGLGGGLAGGLGGLLAGGAAGSVLTSGLNDLLRQFQQSGHGDKVQSWIGTGENRQVSPDDIEHTLGADTVNSLAEQAGLSKVDLLDGLSRQLPTMIDQLTPQGRLPTDEEAARLL
jgi:uncharacterized protein YidB (DUF937 family)